jgi:hypothetical protein
MNPGFAQDRTNLTILLTLRQRLKKFDPLLEWIVIKIIKTCRPVALIREKDFLRI